MKAKLGSFVAVGNGMVGKKRRQAGRSPYNSALGGRRPPLQRAGRPRLIARLQRRRPRSTPAATIERRRGCRDNYIAASRLRLGS
jgi:hypothetical protein